MNLNLQNKVLPVALVAALLGGTVGAFVMRDRTPQADTRVASANLLPASQQNAGSQAATLRYDDTAARGATSGRGARPARCGRRRAAARPSAEPSAPSGWPLCGRPRSRR